MALRILALGCAALSALFGGLVLFGWLLGDPGLVRIGTGSSALPPLLALALVLSAVVLLLVQRLSGRARDLGVLNAGRYRSLARATSAVVWHADAAGHFRPEAAWRHWTGQPEAEQRGHGWLAALHPDDRDRVKAAWLEAVLECQPFQAACRLHQRTAGEDGEPAGHRHVMLRAVPMRGVGGEVLEWIGTVTDDDDRVRATAALRSAEEKYAKAFHLNPDAVVLTGLERPRVIEVNAGFERLLGYPVERLMPGAEDPVQFWVDLEERRIYLALLMRTGRVTNMRVRLQGADGEVVHGLISSQVIEVDGERCVLSTIRDISQQVQGEQEREQLQRALEDSNRKLERLARQDGLTGVLNRRAFDEALDLELRRAQRNGQALSLVLLDVDCFKQFNDRYGHLAGDDCLRRLAMVLETAFQRSGDVVARYGGEEFAVILPDSDEEAAEVAVEQVLARVRALGIVHADGPADGLVSISAGLATLPAGEHAAAEAADRLSAEAFIAAADTALYAAKDAGRACLRAAASPYGTVAGRT